MNKKIIKSVYINLIITVLVGFLSFIVNKYFASYMGAEDLGLMKLFTQLIAYLSLADMGLSTASTYALYKPISENNKEKISLIISTIDSLYKKISFFIILVGLVINPIVPLFMKEKMNSNLIYLYWSMYVLNTAISYLFAKYSIIFIADQKFDYVRIIEGFSKVVSQLLQIWVLVKYHSFLGFISLLILENLIKYLFYRNHYRKDYGYIQRTDKSDKTIIKDLGNLFWHKIAEVIVFNTDYIIISRFISLSMVGIYSSYLMVVSIITMLVRVLINVLSPKIGAYIAINKKNDIYIYWKNMNVLFIFLGTILTFVTYKLINSFVLLWLGKDYMLPGITIKLMMVNLFIQITRGIVDVFKSNSGFFDDIHLPALEGAINLILSVILVNYIGLNGIIIGTVVSNILIIYLAKPILVFRRCFDQRGREYLKILFEYLVLISTSMLISNYIVEKFNIEIFSWVQWIIKSLLVGIITSIITIITFLLNKNFRNLIRKRR